MIKKEGPSSQKPPRTYALSDAFSRIARGEVGRPTLMPVEISQSFIRSNSREHDFFTIFQSYKGIFDDHYLASIPYIYEENCRQGAAMVWMLEEASKTQERTPGILTIETSEGTFARSVAAMCEARVLSVSTSSTFENFEHFFRNHPSGTHFFHGPFFDLSADQVCPKLDRIELLGEFDFVVEDTAFQMYDAGRAKQVKEAVKYLRSDGILICIEKCLHEDRMVYLSRENQKDRLFKSQYFPQEDIKKKRTDILSLMEKGQVSLSTLCECVNQVHSYIYLTWNSGNFYVTVSSNDHARLKRYIDALGAPKIPAEFLYEPPRRLK